MTLCSLMGQKKPNKKTHQKMRQNKKTRQKKKQTLVTSVFSKFLPFGMYLKFRESKLDLIQRK